MLPLRAPRLTATIFAKVTPKFRERVDAEAERLGVRQSDLVREGVEVARRVREKLADPLTTKAQRKLLGEMLDEREGE